MGLLLPFPTTEHTITPQLTLPTRQQAGDITEWMSEGRSPTYSYSDDDPRPVQEEDPTRDPPYLSLVVGSSTPPALLEEEEEKEEGSTSMTTTTSDPPQEEPPLGAVIVAPSPLKGNSLPIMTKIRTPFVGEVVSFTSSVDPDVEFGIRHVGNREVTQYRNQNQTMRYLQRDSEDGSELVTERDWPAGSMRLSTILLALATWNIVDGDSKPVAINEDTILDYLQPEELEFLYEKVLEENPILLDRAARKNA